MQRSGRDVESEGISGARGKRVLVHGFRKLIKKRTGPNKAVELQASTLGCPKPMDEGDACLIRQIGSTAWPDRACQANKITVH